MKIFVSYRTEDTLWPASFLVECLASHFGSESVLRDLDAVPLGVDFRGTIRSEVSRCDVLIVLIGPKWLARPHDFRRIDHPNDATRIQIETALHDGIPIVPVLVDGALLPARGELPASMRTFAELPAIVLRSSLESHVDIDRLIRSLVNLAKRLSSAPVSQDPEPANLDLQVGGPITVFVSHSANDREWVEREIVEPLRRAGMKLWYSGELPVGTRFEREILDGMRSCEWFLLIASPRAGVSEWIKTELHWAFYHRPTRIIPVIMEACDLWDIHIGLPRLHHVDFTTDELARQKLVTRLTASAHPRDQTGSDVL
jgi:hypothetical protein